MKTNRTYSIDIYVAKDLQQKSNQSQFVEDAIRAKLYSGGELSLHDAHKTTILHHLMRLYDQDSYEWKVIHDLWEVENNLHIIKVREDNA